MSDLHHSFEFCLSCILESEGGYVDHPDDKGGPTNYGITINSLSSYMKTKVTKEEIKNLSLDTVRRFYKTEYWDVMRLDQIDDVRLQLVLFDQAINRGMGPAIKNMNVVIKDQPDAILDLNLLNRVDPLLTAVKYVMAAQMAYVKIVISRPDQMVFLKGWMARTHSLLDRIVSLEQLADSSIQ